MLFFYETQSIIFLTFRLKVSLIKRKKIYIDESLEEININNDKDNLKKKVINLRKIYSINQTNHFS